MVFIINIIVTHFRKVDAEPDPWDGRTLEWSLSSPPPEYNFAIDPVVEEVDDWWHKKYVNGHKVDVIPYQPVVDPSTKHLPNQSFWPIVMGAGITCIASGFFFDTVGLAVSMTGVAITLGSAYGWSYEEP